MEKGESIKQPGLDPEQNAQRIQALEDKIGTIEKRLEELRAEQAMLGTEKDEVSAELAELKASQSAQPDGTEPQPTTVLPGTEPNPAEPKDEKEKKRGRVAKVLGTVAVAAVAALAVFGISKGCGDNNSDRTTTEATPTEQPIPNSNPTNTNPGAPTTGSTAKRSLTKISYKELVGRYGKQDRGNDAEHLIGNINIDPNNKKASYNHLMREINQNPQALAHLNTCINADGSFNTECSSPESVRKMNIRLAEYNKMSLRERAYIAKSLTNKFDQHIKFNGIITHNGLYNTFGITANGKSIFAMQNTRYNDYWLSFTDKNGNKFYVRDCAQVVTPVKTTYKKPVATPTTSKPNPTPTKGVGGKPTPVTPKPQKPTKPVKPTKPEKPTCKTNPEMEGCKPKIDTNTTPAGVPGQNGGSGTKDSGPTGPGVGPAGQPVRPDGTVGGEKLPSAPTPEVPTTPTPLPEQPSAPVQPGEQTGQPTEAPAEPATGPAGTDNASTETPKP